MKTRILQLLIVCTVIFTACNSKYGNLEDGIYADIETKRGNIVFKFYPKEAPLTVANFITLSEGTNTSVVSMYKNKKFFDGLTFHRVAKDFVIQGGDPLANGQGGPGYKFFDEFTKDSTGTLIRKHNDAGIVSMANSGAATNGSQFFITHKPTPWLDNKHTVFGKVIVNSSDAKKIRSQFKDSSETYQNSIIDSIRMSVVNAIEPFDTIQSVKIIRIGSEAKNFDALKIFEEEIEKSEEKEKQRLAKVEADKKAFQAKMDIAKSTKTDSGLQILELKKGKGKKVTEKSDVTAMYVLHLATGQLIQATQKDRPFVFNFSKRPMIAGFKEGVLGLKEGAKVRLFIPYYLAYGEQSYGPFPAKSDIIFDVEILKVN